MNTLRNAAVTQRTPSRAEALLLSLLEEDRNQTEPRCRHFGQCGGCQLQDVAIDNQRKAKALMIHRLLQQVGVAGIPDVFTHAAEPWQYRNRVRFRVEHNELGYSRRASNDFLPIMECPILAPVLWRTARAAQEAVQRGAAHWPDATEAVEVFSNDNGSMVQLSILLNATVQTADRDAPAALRRLCESVQSAVPELAGGGLLVNAAADPALSRRVREAAKVEIARWGSAVLPYRVNGAAYRVSRGAFFQVNRYLTDTMQRVVVEGRSGELAWDLYAGAGLFAVPLASQFRSVVAVEIGQPAANDLQQALRDSGPQHRAVHSTVHDFLLRQRVPPLPDLIVLDPPRAGLGRELTAQLAAKKAREIVYVSCDADTFARDARTLVDSGYTLATLHLFDLFPQTFHTETVAVFRR